MYRSLVDKTGYFDKGFLQFFEWNYLKRVQKADTYPANSIGDCSTVARCDKKE